MDGSSKGGLSLEADRIIRDIGDGKSIVPGNSAKSELIELVSLPEDDNDLMPPPGKGKKLSDQDVSKLKEWIEAGAVVGTEEPEMSEEKPSSGLEKRPDPIDGNWTNKQGKEIKAILVRVEGDKAILRMNGKDYPYPISELSADSQAIVKEFAEASKASGS